MTKVFILGKENPFIYEITGTRGDCAGCSLFGNYFYITMFFH
jgi:hypothetical protein